MNESVTSVSKREQRLGDAAAAIAVVSNEDLRRSGATTIADALRTVPGMNVGSVNSSQWAVSARGFNNLYANKLLVLIDGRVVYTPLFAGTYWDMQQVMMEDVDRVEVIRGPGATVWGANAMNGVINVVSRSAEKTQGSLVFGGAGDGNTRQVGVRQGGAIGEKTFYRVFGSYQANDSFYQSNGREAGDGWLGWKGGVRVDHLPNDTTHMTWQSDVSRALADDNTWHGYNFNTLGRWSLKLADGGSVEAQVYYDRLHRDEAIRSQTTIDTVDFTLQHTFSVGSRHDVIWGAGYRFNDMRVWQTNPTVHIRNPDFGLSLYSAFVQDEFKLVPDKLTLTAGVKVEHNDFTGLEAQPSVRVAWKPTGTQTVWAAVSRAVRTPSALEGGDVFGMEIGAPFPGPDGGLYIPTGLGNANPDSEVVWSYELGWRIQPSASVNVDVATFYNRYSGLLLPGAFTRFTPGVPFGTAELPFVNTADTDSYGGEISVTLSPTNHWRLNVSQSLLYVRAEGLASGINYDPRHQTVLRSSHDVGAKFSIDFQLRHTGEFDVSDFISTAVVPAHTAFDVRLAYRPNEALEFSLVGQDLLDRQHAEQGFVIYGVLTEVPRRVFGKATWHF